MPPPALAALPWKTPSHSGSRGGSISCSMLSPGVPVSSIHTSPPFRGQQLAGSCVSRQGSAIPHCLAGTDPRMRHLPSQSCSCCPHPLSFPRKPCVRSGSDNAGPETWRPDLSQTRPSGLVSALSKRSRVTGVIIAVSCGSQARRSGPFPGRAWAPPPPARSPTQSSLYGNEAGQALAVSASGKPRFGFSPRAQPSLCLDFALSPPAVLLFGYTASRTQIPPANTSKVGHKETPQGTAKDVHLALNATYVSHPNLTGLTTR